MLAQRTFTKPCRSVVDRLKNAAGYPAGKYDAVCGPVIPHIVSNRACAAAQVVGAHEGVRTQLGYITVVLELQQFIGLCTFRFKDT